MYSVLAQQGRLRELIALDRERSRVRITPCPHCGLYIDIPSDHARTCPEYQGRA